MRNPWWWVLLVVGFFAAMFHVLAPVHEFAHWLQGGDEITSWTTTRGVLQPRFIIAGYYGEMAIWCVLSIVLGRWGAFFLGYGTWVALEAPMSRDFNYTITYYATEILGKAPSVAEEAVAYVKQAWTVYAVALLVVMWGLAFLWQPRLWQPSEGHVV